MFDKLIESNSEQAEFKSRKSYFTVSTVVVGALFIAAVVASIYAGEIGLGKMDLELSELIAPLVPDTPEPEPPRAQPTAANLQQASAIPVRTSIVQAPDEQPIAPVETSVVPSDLLVRPRGLVRIGDENTNPPGPAGMGREATTGGDSHVGLSTPQPAVVSDVTSPPEPPPVIKRVPPPSSAVKSLGVINGRATSLPKPAYPAVAKATNVQGKVDVQVIIDESGKVISARAVSGHPFLKGPAEKAAWGARFTPTLLSNVPVKVTGVIVYNFTR